MTSCLLKCFVLALDGLNPQNRSPEIKPNVHDSFVRIEAELINCRDSRNELSSVNGDDICTIQKIKEKAVFYFLTPK